VYPKIVNCGKNGIAAAAINAVAAVITGAILKIGATTFVGTISSFVKSLIASAPNCRFY